MGIQDEDTDPALVTVGTMKKIVSILDALVDYVEAKEWSGPRTPWPTLYGMGSLATCAECGVRSDKPHAADCRWMAIMRAAGRR